MIYAVKPTLTTMPLKRPIHPSLPRPPSWTFICGSDMGKINLTTNLIFRKSFTQIYLKILFIYHQLLNVLTRLNVSFMNQRKT